VHKLMLPRLGQTMEEALFVEWRVLIDQDFGVGELLYEVETEKVTTGVEATLPGRLVRLLAVPDERVEVGALLAVVADPGQSPSDNEIAEFLAGLTGESGVPSEEKIAEVSTEKPVPIIELVGDSRVRATPRVRALARDLGVDLSQITSDSTVLITEDQVRQAAAVKTPQISGAPITNQASVNPSSAPISSQELPGVRVAERRKLAPVARRMAEVVTRSWNQVPQFSQSVQVDCSGWRNRRDALRGEIGNEISYTDLILGALIRAVQEVPAVNASFAGDHLILYGDVNVSIAVDTPSGLQVPVLHSLQDRTPTDISRLLREQATKARNDQLTRDDVQGGTITLSNLGMFGIEGGTPLVTTPQACIVFIGAVVDRVVAIEGGFGLRPVCTLVNAFDHRVLDGATAAKFTSALRRHLEEG
jgi:pyruvate dehydrogenase E2 component (dihydrolipoamide acetyltransferase)